MEYDPAGFHILDEWTAIFADHGLEVIQKELLPLTSPSVSPYAGQYIFILRDENDNSPLPVFDTPPPYFQAALKALVVFDPKSVVVVAILCAPFFVRRFFKTQKSSVSHCSKIKSV